MQNGVAYKTTHVIDGTLYAMKVARTVWTYTKSDRIVRDSEIDEAPAITGVEEGKTYTVAVTPDTTDTDIKTVVLTKDNVVVDGYKLGTAISENGAYKLTVTDNASQDTVINFTVNIPVIKVTPVENEVVTATAVTEGETLAKSTLSGTFKVSAEDATTVNGTLEWKDSTKVVSKTGQFAWTFKPTDSEKYNVVEGQVSVTANPAIEPKTSEEFKLVAENNTVTITLTDGTFKTGEIKADDFIFTGTDADALKLGTFTRVDDTTVTITGLTGLTGTNNKVTVNAATQATQASAVKAEASTK